MNLISPNARWVAAACIGLLAAGCAGRGEAPSTIVLVTIDTLRADRVSFAGYGLPTTPFLDSLAKDGIVFSRGYAPSTWTPPSMASLFTSVYPTSHGVTSGVIQDGAAYLQPVLREDFVTLAEMIREAGYVTIGIPANRHLGDTLGFQQGFDHYYGNADFLNADEVNQEVLRQLNVAFGPDWREARKKSKLFLWIHYFDPHDPYLPYGPWTRKYDKGFQRFDPETPAFLTMTELKARFEEVTPELRGRIGRLYDAEIRKVNDYFEALWREIGFGDETLLILTSDHGEEIGDHGKLGHSHSVYEELVHIPLLVRWPERFPGGRSLESPVSLLDIYPTIAELLDVPCPEYTHGTSLLPVLDENLERVAASPLFYELHPPKTPTTGIRQDHWKLVIMQLEDVTDEMLFNLEQDPHEKNNLAAQHSALVARLKELIANWREELTVGKVEMHELTDPEIRKKLFGLGYVQ